MNSAMQEKERNKIMVKFNEIKKKSQQKTDIWWDTVECLPLGCTCLTIRVLSLQGVDPLSLSPSSCTIMVFTDSVSPLLSLKEPWDTFRYSADFTDPCYWVGIESHIHCFGVLWTRGGLFASLLIHLLIIVFIRCVWFFTRRWIICHLILRANVIHSSQLLGQSC